ncbi:hypothetical protein UFOVP581_27 [uncultured Caudovirales phage]|uniref:DNA transfer protein n=1 Tax=uncultured Caudovirales phage TaxID=2100421 RepID=A0A6J5PHJ8_9CAUD|nr:hypothetical protein UFOVP581_27 [uncultured Caudovirales phage]
MSAVAAMVAAGGSLVSGYFQGEAQKDAAETAAGAQMASSQMSIEEQRRQFDAVQKLLAPYVNAGTSSILGQQDLIGMSGANAQQQAINSLQTSPQFQAMMQQGENAMLQNASATGGLRGGNMQAALAQFRPQLLSQVIDQQYSRLGALSGLGQASATGQAAAAQQMGANVGNALTAQGQALAGSALATGQANANMWGTIGNTFGQGAGLLAARGMQQSMPSGGLFVNTNNGAQSAAPGTSNFNALMGFGQ